MINIRFKKKLSYMVAGLLCSAMLVPNFCMNTMAEELSNETVVTENEYNDADCNSVTYDEEANSDGVTTDENDFEVIGDEETTITDVETITEGADLLEVIEAEDNELVGAYPEWEGGKFFTDPEEEKRYFLEELKKRNPRIVISVSDKADNSEFMQYCAQRSFCEDIIGAPGDEGDYLDATVISLKWALLETEYYHDSETDATIMSLVFEMEYRTTYEDEVRIKKWCDKTLSELKLDGKSESEKAEAIYNRIAKRLNDDPEMQRIMQLFGSEDSYSAGFSTLYYRLGKDAGLDVRRIVIGDANLSDNTWNMVRIGDFYYFVDSYATFGLSEQGPDYSYFLLSEEEFLYRKLMDDVTWIEEDVYTSYKASKYCSAEFKSKYPIANISYGKSEGIKENIINWYAMSDTINGKLCSTSTQDRPKVIFLYDAKNDQNFANSAYKAACSILELKDIGRIANVDIVFWDYSGSREDIIAFAEKAGGSEGYSDITWATGGVESEMLSAYAVPKGNTNTLSSENDNHVVVYIDANNKVQHVESGYGNWGNRIEKMLELFCDEPNYDYLDRSIELYGTTVCVSDLGDYKNMNLKFYFDMGDAFVDDMDSQLVFTYDFGSGAKTVEIQRKSISASKCMVNGTVKNCYCADFNNIPAKDIGTEIYVYLKDSEGNCSAVVSDSIKKYAKKILDNPGKYSEYQDVMKAILNYGAYSQLYFNYRTDNLANSILKEEDKQPISNVDRLQFESSYVKDFDNYYPIKLDDKLSGVNYIGLSLIMMEKSAVRFYFKVDNHDIIEELIYVKGVDVDSEGTPLKDMGEAVRDCGNNIFYIEVRGNLLGYSRCVLRDLSGGRLEVSTDGMRTYYGYARLTENYPLMRMLLAYYSFNSEMWNVEYMDEYDCLVEQGD